MRPELIRATELIQTAQPDNLNEALALLQSTVYSFSMQVCGQRQDAEDTAQEVLIRSLPHLSKLRDPKAMSVWLYKVAKHRCGRMRKNSQYAPSRTLSLDELMPNDSELQLLLRDSAATPERQVSDQEQSERVRQAILTLPPQYRLVIVLHDMEEMNADQVSEILGIKTGAVRVRLHRARLALRRALAQTSPERVPPGRDQKVSRSRKCRAVFARLSDYLDNALQPTISEATRKHIEGCVPCLAFVEDLRRAVERCRLAGVECPDDVQRRLTLLLHEEQQRLTGNFAKKIVANV